MKKKKELKVIVNEGNNSEFNEKFSEVTFKIFKSICPEELQLLAIEKFEKYKTNKELT